MFGIETAKQTIKNMFSSSVIYAEDDAAETEQLTPFGFSAVDIIADIIEVGSLVEDAGGFIWMVDSIHYSAFPLPIDGEFVEAPTMWVYLTNPMGAATFNADYSLQQPASDMLLWDEVQPFAPMLTGEAFRQAVLQ